MEGGEGRGDERVDGQSIPILQYNPFNIGWIVRGRAWITNQQEAVGIIMLVAWSCDLLKYDCSWIPKKRDMRASLVISCFWHLTSQQCSQQKLPTVFCLLVITIVGNHPFTKRDII